MYTFFRTRPLWGRASQKASRSAPNGCYPKSHTDPRGSEIERKGACEDDCGGVFQPWDTIPESLQRRLRIVHFDVEVNIHKHVHKLSVKPCYYNFGELHVQTVNGLFIIFR